MRRWELAILPGAYGVSVYVSRGCFILIFRGVICQVFNMGQVRRRARSSTH